MQLSITSIVQIGTGEVPWILGATEEMLDKVDQEIGTRGPSSIGKFLLMIDWTISFPCGQRDLNTKKIEGEYSQESMTL